MVVRPPELPGVGDELVGWYAEGRRKGGQRAHARSPEGGPAGLQPGDGVAAETCALGKSVLSEERGHAQAVDPPGQRPDGLVRLDPNAIRATRVGVHCAAHALACGASTLPWR